MSKGSEATTSSTRTFMTPKPETKASKKTPKPPKPRRSLPTLRLQWLVMAILLAFSLFMYVQYRDAKHKLAAPSASNSHQVADVVSRVRKLILLPSNETPTIITVKDATQLKGEQFYADAKNGDVTLVYAREKRAILYRPSQNIIVNVANVTLTNQ